MPRSRSSSSGQPDGAAERLVVDDREVAVSNPGKVLFPEAGHTKLDLVRYYLAVADGALRGAGGRPNVMVRYPNGIGGEHFFQKRAPASRPPWVEVVSIKFPSGRSAEEVVPRDAAALAWLANLACLELHPHPVRADDLDHPDELRVDLDPVPGVEWDQVRRVARVVEEALGELGLTGWPKTSGSRGLHVIVRIERRWSFEQVRRAALALARDVERRAPALATSKWWKEERHGVFVDYNQNAKDRTVASAYSVRPTPDARVSTPFRWDELEESGSPRVHPGDGAGTPRRGRRSARGDRRSRRLARPAAGAVGAARGGGPGRRPLASALREAAGRAAAGAAVTRRAARASKHPLIEIGRARRKEDALAGLERWKARHPEAAAHLEPADVLVDAMRGRWSTWTRVRVNLQHVPAELRPAQEPLDPDEKTLASS